MRNRKEFIEELARLFNQEALALALLEDIDFPNHHAPVWGAPGVTTFLYWTQVVRELENGRMEGHGPERLAEGARTQYPGNRVFIEAAAVPEDLAPPQVVPPRTQTPQAVPRRAPTEPRTWPTLVFTGSERYDAFMRLVRELIGPEARLLYAAATETAVYIPDPGPRAEALVAQLRQRAEQIDPEAEIQVRFEEYDFQPYLIQTLHLIGPDQQMFVAENIPATLPVRDIPHAVMGMYAAEGREDRFGRNRRTVVDRVVPGEDGAPPRVDRLNPDHTLHQAGVEEGDQLQVQADSTAGAVGAQRRIEALARVRNEIHEYADDHPSFTIVKTDDDLFPTYYEVEFRAPGFGPPKEPVQAGEPIDPVPQDLHRLSIVLPYSFPLVPPFVLFHPPFFHPNIEPREGGEVPKGTTCLGPIRDSYRPDLDFHDLCQLLVDIVSWRNYGALRPGVLDSHGFLDPVAAEWALSEEGQERIVQRGGISLAALEQLDEPERRPLPIRVRHLGQPVVSGQPDEA